MVPQAVVVGRALIPIDLTLFGFQIIHVNLSPAKASISIDDTESGITSVISSEHNLKAESPIDVTVEGITTLVKGHPANFQASITFIPVGRIIDVSCVKVYCFMEGSM